jgi:hypothetical protein
MKLKVEEKTTYAPKTLTITFESAEEEKMFNHMIGCGKYTECSHKGDVDTFRAMFREQTRMGEWLI